MRQKRSNTKEKGRRDERDGVKPERTVIEPLGRVGRIEPLFGEKQGVELKEDAEKRPQRGNQRQTPVTGFTELTRKIER